MAAYACGKTVPMVCSGVERSRYQLQLLSSKKATTTGRMRSIRATLDSAVDLEVATSKLSNVLEWEKGKRLQTQTTPIAPSVTTIRSLDWDRDRFDIEFGLQNGTTYNSFIIDADKPTVIDASHEKFKGLYLSAIKEHIDPSTIEYIIANHTEPDHSGLIPDLLELAPNATVVGSKTCIIFLQNLVLRPFKSLVVKGGDTLDLGRGHILEFVMAPNLHWPDTMFTLDHGTKVLFTCDAFGMHYCSKLVYDEDLGAIEPHYRFYYDCLMRPNSRSVITALKRIAEKDFRLVATGHGPLLRYNVAELMNKYEMWSKQAQEKQLATVAVLYVSDYGFSDRLSQTLARGLTKTNTGVEMMDLNIIDIQDMIECVGKCAGVVIMVPPSSGPASKALSTLYAAVKPKQPIVIAESYGGDDEPVDTLVQRFVALGISLPIPPLRVKEIPNEATYQQFEEAGTDLGQLLSQKKTIEAKKAGMPINISKAIARISGGLYVVTAVKGTSKGAMIASWVSQASFKPLGVTIAVAKDRAIESLMQVQDTFVLNCLEEGKYAPLMKHFLKRFPPGADRFEGVEWSPATNGSPILIECISYLECKVVSRMETSDHWIVYSHVINGNVSKPEGRTAAHHRKVGNYY
uniref:TSA: Wollemia nobilis Ref_Wollemi_Transcript_11596_2105 transcribed RNA sequence n=1 Tax=Wollemia nobilis TaxID=56998 RepID=A0A0C9RM04_9CONI